MSYYDRAGQRITQNEWLELFSQGNRVALDVFPNGAQVSTVWLGLDHSFGGKEPLCWETMIFHLPGQECELQWRYTSEQDALKSHRILVDVLKRGGGVPELRTAL